MRRELVYFFHEKIFREKAAQVVHKQMKWINERVPNGDILHVGSTAVAGSLTKGDVDLQVRVSQNDFNAAREALMQLYPLNDGSTETTFFCAFEKEDELLPLGVQLTVISSELDLFWKWTRFQESHPDFLHKYNRLKEQFHGKEMDLYRREKNRFFETVLTSETYQSFVQQIDRTKGGSDGE